ncbi:MULTISPECIES: DUF6884 domain-containing protein [unclassified Bradyrhizobium]|uniref:DUF6884 domain-containing protein n=1 Tax=unclassified Bradyrhizobium TaxID=2631580 RepID=UPI001FFC0E18|nr:MULTISPECIES: DUF6884 domain-containing protein [unclassified Bradyrhizobium]MCK1266886.1 hypothetical protein [Bradyrhizobium sp. 84]MCK1369734.1 hypothetical protein [Bradyrhizobium sp. 49]MCK1430659.1 hypothetical protein [Bradyrhizobium sp. 87]
MPQQLRGGTMSHSLSAKSDQLTFDWLDPDRDELARLAKQFVDEVTQLPKSAVALVSCGKHKKDTKSIASELYTSPRFRMSINLISRLQKRAFILSAKHGLLTLSTQVAPYDVNLSTFDEERRFQWRSAVLSKLNRHRRDSSAVILLADDEYATPLDEGLKSIGFKVINPLTGLSSSARLMFLKACHHYLDRIGGIEELYAIFDRLHAAGHIKPLKEALGGALPDQGVYFFFDPAEKTLFSESLPRLVRVGTHGVSAGSRATLRDRLRTHLGTSDGYGNHRSSVFRLHVGEALIRRDGMRDRYPNWGIGQNLTGADRDNERPLEKVVSEIIGSLSVCCIAVADKSAKESARSVIERLSIALFTEHLLPVEASGPLWLGLHSKHDVIAKTGLWNLRDAGSKADLSIPRTINARLIKSGVLGS